MPDVLIRRLRLRIVRRGSLFWGDDPRALARRALSALPQLVAEQIDALGMDVDVDHPIEVPGPVRVHARGTLASLLAALHDESPALPLRSIVREALRDALESSRATVGDRARAEGADKPAPSTTVIRSALGELLPLFLAGELPARLSRMAPGLVEAYHRLLLVEFPVDVADPTRAVTADELGEAQNFLEALAAGFAAGKQVGTSATRLRERIVAAVALAARTGIHPFDAGVRSLLDRYLPIGPVAAAPNPTPAAPVVSAAPGDGDQPPASLSSVAPGETSAPQRAGETTVREPDKRTRRNASGEERPAPILPLLVASLLTRRGAMAIVEARLRAIGRETDFPLWMVGLAFKLGPAPVRGWMYLEETWQHVAAAADCALVSGESLAQFADDPRARWGEVWAAMLEVLGSVTSPESAIDGVSLFASRPACALARTLDFDGHLSRAAAWALEQISGVLWPGDGQPIHSAFERLSSLEVQLRRDDAGIHVRVPLGKRHTDLFRAGLLADVPRAPWLGGGAAMLRFYAG